MILSEHEIESIHADCFEKKQYDWFGFASAIEAAVIAKLVKGEVPLPQPWVEGAMRKQWDSEDLYATHQLRSYGDAREAAGVLREREVFSTAAKEELPRVSHIEYDSHEICKHFISKVFERAAEIRSRSNAGINGLTEAETAASASVMGIVNRKDKT